MTGKHGGELWAITAFFNPAGYVKRLANYRIFRKHLQAPLLAVELSFDGRYELCDEDADKVIRIAGGDVMWQKERLLNLALDALPANCRCVVWVDCDVIFEDDDWAARTSRRLDDCALVQPFNFAYRTTAGWLPGNGPSGAEEWRAIPFLIESGMSVDTCLGANASSINACHGYAWAARRELLEAHRFYDACIIGGADSAIVRAAYGRLGAAAHFQKMNDRRTEHFNAWARPFAIAAAESVGSIGGRVFHLWHGPFANRRYTLRFGDFHRFAFDPSTDIAVDDSGAWRWNTDKPEMHDHVRSYFAQRREDD